MIIRKAKIKDIENISKNNILLALESENKSIDFDTVYDGVKNIINDENKGFYLVFELNNKIIGQLMITYEWSDWYNKMNWWIQSVYIDELNRRKGIFNKLIDYLKKLAIEKNISVLKLYVYKKNLLAKKVYEKIGFNEALYDIYDIKL
jgi:ribosomal protein S18 acetylase RimI-like enzyme